MKKAFIIALALIMQLSAFADGNPMWNNYGKTVQVKGGAGIEQFVEAILGYKPDDWSRDPVYDKRNGFFHYYEEGSGHIEYYVSYWNRNDGKKLVIMSYDEADFGKPITPQSSPWGYYSTTMVADNDMESEAEGVNTDTGFRAYLYDEAKKQLTPLTTPPFNGFDNPVKNHYLLMLPQQGKDIRVREQKDEAGFFVYHTLKWNGMTFDFIREGNVVASFFGTEANINIRTAPNGRIVYTTPNTGEYSFDIVKIENGWCLIDGTSIYENEESTMIELNGSNSGYWVHSSCIGAKGGNGDGAVTLLASPDDNAKVVYKSNDYTIIEPIEIRGEWVKVRARVSKKVGWIRIYDMCSNPLTNCC